MPRQVFSTYKNAVLKYINLHANGSESILYDIISIIRTPKASDTILILGVSGCIFLPIYRLFSNKNLIINIDGIEHKRAKFGFFTKKFLKLSEYCAIKYANKIITDNKGIQDYVKTTYNKNSYLIAYGGDHVLKNMPQEVQQKILDQYNLQKKSYCIEVCRIEPENNCHVVLDAFSRIDRKLVFIGNWDRSEYGRQLKERYRSYKNIVILDPIYDITTLYALRSNAEVYIHGHSAGGTNPSLVEAMFFGIPIIAFDIVFNRETTDNMAEYFTSADDIIRILATENLGGDVMKDIASKKYTWKRITEQYESLY